MKRRLFLSALLALLLAGGSYAIGFVNITPKPKSIVVGNDSLVLPRNFAIFLDNLPDSMAQEVYRFASSFQSVTGLALSVEKSATAGTLISVAPSTLVTSLGSEGYKLSVTATGIKIEACATAGLYYAFQTLKKMLPPHVMAAVPDATVTRYVLPAVEITDAPRFSYRGFMLDVGRHFFSKEEVMRMIEVMSYYKMNRFHWHLTEDQGWRVEIKKYPRLTTVGSVRSTSYNVDPVYGRYNQYAPYGPYFYTQEDIKEVVAYARDRHIEIVPEVDLPGHCCAAMASYPQFSCNPDGSHTVQTDGGIFADVLNVANPGAIQFAKDVLDELSALFPYPYIHIGGDECPTSAWESNAECRAVVAQEGLPNYRRLQTRFIKILADYMGSKSDTAQRRKLIVWNEAISASGADTEMMRHTGATVMCWQPCDASALQAAQLGMSNIVTPYGPYYINRKQSTDAGEPAGAGDGSDNLQKTYAYVPIPTANKTYSRYYTGVQGTFWTEHVSSNYLLEYLALPRLMAVAETGWSLEGRKNFEDFCRRITADSVLLNYNRYAYGRHYMKSGNSSSDTVMPTPTTSRVTQWYRIVTRNTTDANRKGKCIELLRAGSPLLANTTARVGRLWSALPAQEGEAAYDYQLWAVKEDSVRPGHYALVCKAQSEGSLNPVATAQNNTGRWDYDAAALHCNFLLGDEVYTSNGSNYCYSIHSEKSPANLWMNMAASGQYYSINQYANPSDGNSGIWEFQPIGLGAAGDSIKLAVTQARTLLGQITTYRSEEEMQPGRYGEAQAAALGAAVGEADAASTLTPAALSALAQRLYAALGSLKSSLAYPQSGVRYRFTNTGELSRGLTLCDTGKGNLMTSDDRWAANAWIVTSLSTDGEVQHMKMQNAATKRWVNGATSPLKLTASASSAATYNNTFSPALGDFTLAAGSDALFPISLSYAVNGGSVYVGGIRPQGTGWKIEPVVLVTYRCLDTAGKQLGLYTESLPLGSEYTPQAPEIAHFTPLAQPASFVPLHDDTLDVTYSRSSYAVTVNCCDAAGRLIESTTLDVPVGSSVSPRYPLIDYYTFDHSDLTGDESFVPKADVTITATYTTLAVAGFAQVGSAVTSIASGKSYLLYDAVDVSGRTGYLNVSLGDSIIYTTDGLSWGSPLYVWNLLKNGTSYTLQNGCGLSMPAIPSGSNVTASSQAGRFTFTLNDDGETWTVKCSNGYYWNGNSGSFTGWSNGHPYKLYDFTVAPYFPVACNYQDENGQLLSRTFSYVKGGSSYTLNLPQLSGYLIDKIEGDTTGLSSVARPYNLTFSYKYEGTAVKPVEQNTFSGTSPLYDSAGRRVAVATHGLYIQKGKKILK